MSFLKDQRKPELKAQDIKRFTKSEFKNECDINVIMKKYQKTGVLPIGIENNGVYLDVSDVPTYQDCLNTVISAQNAFNELPSALRKRFGGDIERYLEYVNDPKNVSEMIELGMIEKKVAPMVQSEVSNSVTPK